MQKHSNNWLQIKVFVGLGLLLFGSTAVVIYLNFLAQENYASQQILSNVRQLNVQGEAIKRRATTYAQNAPRDYAPYERDISIFYPDFMHDLNAFDQQITVISSMENGLSRSLFHSSDKSLTSSIQTLQSNWRNFQQGLQQKLGNDPQQPRLEWGADYVQENQELINTITGMLIYKIDNVIQQQLDANKRLSKIAVSSAGTLLILGVIWFYFSVVRRISLTVKGCQRVAQGDFGYQLENRGNDELTALARAFNTLSARTRFVLTMLSKMHRYGSAESKVDSLWEEASGYLPIQWLGLWQINRTDNSLEFMSMRADRTIRETMQQALIKSVLKDQHLLNMGKDSLPVKYDNLSTAATSIPNAKHMREILKMGLLKSELIVPLTSDDGWEGILIFVASDEAAYTDEQVELMGNLASYMANGFAQKEISISEKNDSPMAAHG